MRIIERWFWAFCVAAALAGLFLPVVGMPLSKIVKPLLGGILFFTGLKLNFSAAFREIKRPKLVIYLTIMRLLVFPAVMYALARLVLPWPMAVGVLIVASMPSGAACSALADIMRGNPSLSLVGTVMTSLFCPLTIPVVIEACSGLSTNGGLQFLGRQAAFLALILFVPLCLALCLRKLFPSPIRERRNLWSSLSMVSLFLLICGALSSVSNDFTLLIRTQPAQAAGLCAFMCFFSFFFHTAGYFIAPWRPLSDRASLSINGAYVNNALAIVFASQFFRDNPLLGAAAVLPAILLEIPMDLALVPFRAFIASRMKKTSIGN